MQEKLEKIVFSYKILVLGQNFYSYHILIAAWWTLISKNVLNISIFDQ